MLAIIDDIAVVVILVTTKDTKRTKGKTKQINVFVFFVLFVVKNSANPFLFMLQFLLFRNALNYKTNYSLS